MIGQIRLGESGSGVTLMAIGILSNIRTNNPIRVGNTNRAGFYGVVVVIAGYMLYINRIDQIVSEIVESTLIELNREGFFNNRYSSVYNHMRVNHAFYTLHIMPCEAKP